MPTKSLIIAALSLVLTACTAHDGTTGASPLTAETGAYSPGPEELAGRVLRIEDAEGRASVVNFAPDGSMTVQLQPGETPLEGTWGFRGGIEAQEPEPGELAGIPATPASQGMQPREWLCMNYRPRGQECWLYQAPLLPGEPVSVTTDRGREITLTLLAL